MKVDDIPAGCELDALVAEKVMGWHKVRQEGNDVAWETSAGLRTWELTSFGSFKPSTDIKAAWEVVKEVMEMPGDLSWDFARNIEWACHVRTFWDNDSVSHHILEEITPEIICRAALKAVGILEVPSES